MLALPLYDDTPSPRPPVVTIAVIFACSAIFLWQLGQGERGAERVALEYGLIPSVLFGAAELPPSLDRVPAWATLVTSMFLHGGWLHLIGNMIYLWIFGKSVESTLGPMRFAIFYLVTGLGAALVQALVDPAAEVPVIGASGAIAGILGAYLVLYPRGNVVVFIWIFVFVRLVSVPAVILLGLWFLLQLVGALSAPASDSGVAVWAHVGGFVMGAVLVVFFRRPGTGMFGPARTNPFAMDRAAGRFGARLPPPRDQRGPWE